MQTLSQNNKCVFHQSYLLLSYWLGRTFKWAGFRKVMNPQLTYYIHACVWYVWVCVWVCSFSTNSLHVDYFSFPWHWTIVKEVKSLKQSQNYSNWTVLYIWSNKSKKKLKKLASSYLYFKSLFIVINIAITIFKSVV